MVVECMNLVITQYLLLVKESKKSGGINLPEAGLTVSVNIYLVYEN